jgi:hypothetical protein
VLLTSPLLKVLWEWRGKSFWNPGRFVRPSSPLGREDRVNIIEMESAIESCIRGKKREIDRECDSLTGAVTVKIVKAFALMQKGSNIGS